jgi:CHAT domain-containing protein
LEALRTLRRALWDPLAIHDGAVVVVPAAELHGIPIESLPTVEDLDGGPPANGPVPVVSRLPHPALLTRSARPRSGSALLLHDGRPGTAAEVERVRAMLRRHGVPTRVGSRVSDLRRLPATPRLIHVAAHGSYSRDEWILSGIRLSDGWLGLEELHGRRPRDAAVVLGSCESGLENGLPGAALDGWLTAGLGSGAREMVLSLWKIDDASALAFAEEFYPRWCAGGSAAAAAAQARSAVRGRLPHPFSWAAWLAAGASLERGRSGVGA